MVNIGRKFEHSLHRYAFSRGSDLFFHNVVAHVAHGEWDDDNSNSTVFIKNRQY